jgi:hypothetical protein
VAAALWFDSSIHLTGRALLSTLHPPDQPGAKKPPINPKTTNPTMTADEVG